MDSSGFCQLPSCTEVTEDLTHILLLCPSYEESRHRVLNMWLEHLTDKPHIQSVVQHYTATQDTDSVQFLLDPSVLPLVISLQQEHTSRLKQLVII